MVLKRCSCTRRVITRQHWIRPPSLASWRIKIRMLVSTSARRSTPETTSLCMGLGKWVCRKELSAHSKMSETSSATCTIRTRVWTAVMTDTGRWAVQSTQERCQSLARRVALMDLRAAPAMGGKSRNLLGRTRSLLSRLPAKHLDQVKDHLRTQVGLRTTRVAEEVLRTKLH